MANKVIVESYSGHMKRKILLWFIPIMIILVSIVFVSIEGFNFDTFKEVFLGFLIGGLWLGLLIYFKFVRKK